MNSSGTNPRAIYTLGEHGYDPKTPEMMGIFLAAGPDFRKGVRLGARENRTLHDLLVRLLRLPAARTTTVSEFGLRSLLVCWQLHRLVRCARYPAASCPQQSIQRLLLGIPSNQQPATNERNRRAPLRKQKVSAAGVIRAQRARVGLVDLRASHRGSRERSGRSRPTSSSGSRSGTRFSSGSRRMPSGSSAESSTSR